MAQKIRKAVQKLFVSDFRHQNFPMGENLLNSKNSHLLAIYILLFPKVELHCVSTVKKFSSLNIMFPYKLNESLFTTISLQLFVSLLWLFQLQLSSPLLHELLEVRPPLRSSRCGSVSFRLSVLNVQVQLLKEIPLSGNSKINLKLKCL